MNSVEPYLMNGGLAVDDRGSVSFVNDFDFKDVKRFYLVDNHVQGYIRAFHGHLHEAKYVYAAQGSALVVVVDMKTEKISKFVLSSKKPQVLYIPSGYYNGFKTLTEDCRLMFFSTSTLQESLNDDIREDYNKWDVWSENYR